jgi:hypothetical protein
MTQESGNQPARQRVVEEGALTVLIPVSACGEGYHSAHVHGSLVAGQTRSELQRGYGGAGRRRGYDGVDELDGEDVRSALLRRAVAEHL